MTSLITDIVDYVATFFSGDIGTAKCPLLFVIVHSIFLGCVVRPLVDKRPNGEKRFWFTSVLFHVLYMLGGSTLTAIILGRRPGLFAGNQSWFLYALGWFLAGFDAVNDFVLKTAKVCCCLLMFIAACLSCVMLMFVMFCLQPFFSVVHGLCRMNFVSSAIVRASESCPGGLLVIFMPVMDSHATDWISYSILRALEGKPLTAHQDMIRPSPFVAFDY